MKNGRYLVLVMIAVVTISACSKKDNATPAATTTTSQQSASVAQIAGAFSDARDSALQSLQTSIDCFPNTDVTCGVNLLTASIAAQTVSVTLDGLQNPATPAYLGPIPHEIDRLVVDTKNAADQFKRDYDAYDADCLPNGQSDTCGSKLEGLRLEEDGLRTQLKAWDPYE